MQNPSLRGASEMILLEKRTRFPLSTQCSVFWKRWQNGRTNQRRSQQSLSPSFCANMTNVRYVTVVAVIIMQSVAAWFITMNTIHRFLPVFFAPSFEASVGATATSDGKEALLFGDARGISQQKRDQVLLQADVAFPRNISIVSTNTSNGTERSVNGRNHNNQNGDGNFHDAVPTEQSLSEVRDKSITADAANTINNISREAAAPTVQDLSAQRSKVARCMDGLQRDLLDTFKSLRSIHAPLLTTAKRMEPGFIQLNFNYRIRRLIASAPEQEIQRAWYAEVKWFCFDRDPNGNHETNNNNSSSPLTQGTPAVLGPEESGRPPERGRDILIMQCPPTTKFVIADQIQLAINTTTMEFQKVLSATSAAKSQYNADNSMKFLRESIRPTTITYNLTKYLDCDTGLSAYRQTIASAVPQEKQQQRRQNATSSTKFVLCGMLDARNANLIPSWVEYHKMVGFDEVWLYWNSELDALPPDVEQYLTRKDIQQYVTLFPWARDGNKNFHYQPSQTQDCLTMARQWNVTWTFLADVDEYLQVMDVNRTLREIVTPYESQRVSGLELHNFFFGSEAPLPSTEIPSTRETIMLREYQYRQAKGTGRPWSKVKWQRSKVLARAEYIEHFHVHWVTASKPNYKPVRPDYNNMLRSSHFKKPHLGVFESQNATHDSSLADAFANRLEQRLIDVGWFQNKEKSAG